VIRPEGDERWFEIRGRPIRADGASVVEWVGVAFDITSAAQRSLARAEMLGQAVRARRDVERANATLRQAVGRLDTMVRHDHAVADALQRALFTDDLPAVPGIDIAARYLPGSAELTVGGDWYDVIVRPHGVLLVIGDVVGHGLKAAAVMARIRHSVHFAVSEAPDDLSPAAVLGSINRYLLRQGAGDLATVALLHHEPSGRLRHARAGHPPVIVASRYGPARFLEGGLGPPLGAFDGATYADAEDRVVAGDTIVLYTDGLIERRREPLDRSLDRLRRAIEASPRAADEMLEAVFEAVLDGEPADDVAVLAAQTHTG
jgi:serine phosphatase RsbU (regulator of sigma subunit)